MSRVAFKEVQEMARVNLDGKFPCMSNWITLKRTSDGVIARNGATDDETLLSEREAYYLKSLNGDRDIFKIRGFSRDECMKYYEHLDECLLIRDEGRTIKLEDACVHTVYIPNKKSTNSIIPKLLNFLLLISFLPVLTYGAYLIFTKGVYWGDSNGLILNMVLGYGLGIVGGVVLHETAHAIACLGYGGKLLEAGVMTKGIMPGAYVLIDDYVVDSGIKKAQINMAGIEMNLLIAGIMMILMVKVDVSSCLFEYKNAMRYIALINIICALLNISFAEGLDGEHAMSSLIGTPVIDVAKANILQMTTRKNRKKYFSRMGITGVANVCTSVLIIGFQLIIPIFILTNICIFIESLILWGIV
mgnify:CR=1 FL=1